MATATAKNTSFKIPTWNSSLNRWWLRIGKVHTKAGQLTDKAFYWTADYNGGTCPASVIAEAVEHQKAWNQTVAEWPLLRPRIEAAYKSLSQPFYTGPDLSKPIWIDREELAAKEASTAAIKAKLEAHEHKQTSQTFIASSQQVLTADPSQQFALIQQLLASGLLPKTIATSVAKDVVTIEQAVDLYVEGEKKREGLKAGKGLKAGSINTKQNNLLISIGKTTHVEGRKKGRALKTNRKPIDYTINLQQITKQHLTDFVNFWLSDAAAVSERTGINYCRSFKSFLNWCDDHEAFGFSLPKGSADLFSFKTTEKTKIEELEPKAMKKLLDACGEKTRLYILLMCNCGYYASDIGDLKFDDLTVHDGDHCIWRGRTKTSHQNEFESLHVLWPETYELLMKYKAPKDNAFGRLLLTQTGLPLYREAVGEFKNMAIARAIENARDVSGVDIAPKQFRKFGATAIARLGASKTTNGGDVARLYAGQVIPGSLKFYAKEHFTPLTKALKKWRLELKALKVI